ncbi:MAG: hypothetical protein ABSD20_08895 [Terriglobales bacterium]
MPDGTIMDSCLVDTNILLRISRRSDPYTRSWTQLWPLWPVKIYVCTTRTRTSLKFGTS